MQTIRANTPNKVRHGWKQQPAHKYSRAWCACASWTLTIVAGLTSADAIYRISCVFFFVGCSKQTPEIKLTDCSNTAFNFFCFVLARAQVYAWFDVASLFFFALVIFFSRLQRQAIFHLRWWFVRFWMVRKAEAEHRIRTKISARKSYLVGQSIPPQSRTDNRRWGREMINFIWLCFCSGACNVHWTAKWIVVCWRGIFFLFLLLVCDCVYQLFDFRIVISLFELKSRGIEWTKWITNSSVEYTISNDIVRKTISYDVQGKRRKKTQTPH